MPRNHRRRRHRESRDGGDDATADANAPLNLDDMEMMFVQSCGGSARDRLAASMQFAVAFDLRGMGLDKIMDFGVADNLALVVSERHPYIVYAKYLAERSLTKVMLHKTETRIDALLVEASDGVGGGQNLNRGLADDMRRADNTILGYVVTSCIHVLRVVDPDDDPYALHRNVVSASLRVLLEGGARFTQVAASLPRNVDADALLHFSNNPATKAAVAVCALIVALGDPIVRVLHPLYNEGLGQSLIHQLDENNGALISAHLGAQQSLVEHTREEADAAAQKQAARDEEEAKASALAYARKEAKKGKSELKARFKEATEEHDVALKHWRAQVHAWEVADQRMKNTAKALRRISLQLCHVIDCAGVFSLHVRQAKLQAMDEGIVDVLTDLMSQHNLDENKQGAATHLRVRVSAARALGRICCGEFAPAQKRVAHPLGGHIALLELFQFEFPPSSPSGAVSPSKSSSRAIEQDIDCQRWAAQALRQCCGEQTKTVRECISGGALMVLMDHVKACLNGARADQASESSSAAAQCIGHLTASSPGLDILGGESVLPVLLQVMANGTDSSSHAARIIGNAFSGAPASSFQALVSVGGLESITEFLKFISAKTLSRVNSKNQLRVLGEVLRAAQMCINGFAPQSQAIVSRGGIIKPLENLSTWIFADAASTDASSSASGHGDVQAAALRCLDATVCGAGNIVGKSVVSRETNMRSLLRAMLASDHAPAQVAFSNLFATMAKGAPATQNMFLNTGVFATVGTMLVESEQKGYPPGVRAATARMLHASILDNAHMLVQVREYQGRGFLEGGILVGKATLASKKDGFLKVCSAICGLLQGAARNTGNREHVRQLGGLAFCCACLASVPLQEEETKQARKIKGRNDERAAGRVAQGRLIVAACDAIVALCFCDGRAIDAVAKDKHVVVTITQMLASRGSDKKTLHLCATLIPMCAVGADNKQAFLDIGGLSLLCRRLGNVLKEEEPPPPQPQQRQQQQQQEQEQEQKSGRHNFPKGLSLRFYRITVKLITAVGSCVIRSPEGQRVARIEGCLDHMVCVMRKLGSDDVPRKDPRWEALLTSVCDALHWTCARNPESQQELKRIGGGKALFHLLGDGDLRSVRLRGACSDASRSSAHGWGDAEDSMNIVLL
jgi:hypothetical protein